MVDNIPVKKIEEYYRWKGMIDRCHLPNRKDSKYYHDKGVRVCKSWHKFENWYEWFRSELEKIGNVSGRLDIDRINTNGNYCPSNCRLLSHSENVSRAVRRRVRRNRK